MAVTVRILAMCCELCGTWLALVDDVFCQATPLDFATKRILDVVTPDSRSKESRMFHRLSSARNNNNKSCCMLHDHETVSYGFWILPFGRWLTPSSASDFIAEALRFLPSCADAAALSAMPPRLRRGHVRETVGLQHRRLRLRLCISRLPTSGWSCCRCARRQRSSS